MHGPRILKKLDLEPSAATRPFLRELGLLVDDDSVERPSIAAVLSSAASPSDAPHAVITATIDGKKRKVITGNLLRQRKDLLEWAEQRR